MEQQREAGSKNSPTCPREIKLRLQSAITFTRFRKRNTFSGRILNTIDQSFPVKKKFPEVLYFF